MLRPGETTRRSSMSEARLAAPAHLTTPEVSGYSPGRAFSGAQIATTRLGVGPNRDTRTVRSLVALAAIFATFAVSQTVWLAHDDALLANTDARHHFANLRIATDRVASGGIAALPDAVASASLGGRPPLYAFIAAPFFACFGRSEDAAPPMGPWRGLM